MSTETVLKRELIQSYCSRPEEGHEPIWARRAPGLPPLCPTCGDRRVWAEAAAALAHELAVDPGGVGGRRAEEILATGIAAEEAKGTGWDRYVPAS